MIELDLNVDLEDVVDGFDDMTRKGRNLTPVWRRVAPELKKDIKASGRRREGPDGKWAPLAAATMEKRRKQKAAPRGKKWKRKIAAATLGKLRAQFDVEWGPKFIRAISRIPFSGAHQEGATVGRGSRIPPRVHVYASENLMTEIVDKILRHITRVF